MRLMDTLGNGYGLPCTTTRKAKQILYQVTSALLGGIFVLGGCPLSIVFFVAGYASGYGRGGFLLLMCADLLLRVPVQTALKYMFAISTAFVIGEWTGCKKYGTDRWFISFSGAFAFLSISFVLAYIEGKWTERYGFFFIQSAVLFLVTEGVRKMLTFIPEKEGLEELEVWNHQVQVKEHLLEVSDTLDNLSKDMHVRKIRVDEELTRQEQIWQGKFMEYRQACAEQLQETAGLIRFVVEDAYDAVDKTCFYGEILKRRLREQNIIAAEIAVLEKKNKSYEVFMQIKSVDGRCILARDAAAYIGRIMKRKFIASKESKRVVNGNFGRLRLVEDVAFHVLYGEARRVKDGECLSGDCFTVFETDRGSFIAGISDGMGSGLTAKEESERVMEVLEQYLQAGFRKEIAAAMMNTAVLMQEDTGFTTMDICEINLYTGVCEFLKTGAAASFLIRNDTVEMVRSMNLPAGVFHRADYQISRHKLIDGDHVVMISDGMLEALPYEHAEELFAEVLTKYKGNNMREFADFIMEHTLRMTGGHCQDDMTVLTLGIWQKN